jgi:hypothetical protein
VRFAPLATKNRSKDANGDAMTTYTMDDWHVTDGVSQGLCTVTAPCGRDTGGDGVPHGSFWLSDRELP